MISLKQLTPLKRPLMAGQRKTHSAKLESFYIKNDKLSLKFAQTPEELDAIQALRYQIFGLEMGSKLPTAHLERDIDEFDDYFDHLMVIDEETQSIVGTYRLMNPENAKKAGSLYSASEFDLSNLQHIVDKSVELGRSCVHKDFRNGWTINLLWQGLTAYVELFNCEYLFGCASVYINGEPDRIHKLTQTLLEKHASPEALRVYPKKTLAPAHFDENTPDAAIPPLLKGYLRAGVLVCGDPSLDEEFGCVDYFIIQPMAEMTNRYKKRYAIASENA